MSNVFKKYQNRYEVKQPEEMTLVEYLEGCAGDKGMYASTSERLLMAIGDAEVVDTRLDERLSRIFSNRKIKQYPAFSDFYGMETTIEDVVSFLTHAAQSLEEKNQILYLLGPVGGGKSSIAERLKELMQRMPIYTIKAWNKNLDRDGTDTDEGFWEISPLFESPLGLFNADEDGEDILADFGIPKRYLGYIMSPWAVKRLEEAEGDVTKFQVVKIWPDILRQIAITKVEPGDENNQDISSLVGKVNISDLEDHDQNDPDAYNWVGGLNVASQGIMEFVEMFKAPIKMLHPLLTATQEGHYNGTEQFGAIPFSGLILAHSNESEWTTFRNDSKNEAFLDRVNIVKVPYVLRVTEEALIYDKLMANSELANAPCAPGTIDMMAQYSILTRLMRPENSSTFSKMEIYNGKNLKDTDPSAKSIDEYKEVAGVAEGMNGSSTRFAFKILSKVFNYDSNEIAADPIHLMYVLEQQILQEQFSQEEEEIRIGYIKGELQPRYAEFLEDELQKAYLESYHDYGQNLFDRYIQLAGFWIEEKDYRDDDTGIMFDRDSLNDELEKIEKPAGISNPKDFRNEVVMFVLRASQSNGGKNPDWTSYQKLCDVIEKKMFANTEELLPVISFQEKQTVDEQDKHDDFVSRMMKKGYTEKQVRRLVDWFLRYSKNN